MCANLDGEVIVCECYQRGFKLGMQVGNNTAQQAVEKEILGWVKTLTKVQDRLDATTKYLRERNEQHKGKNEPT
jgi:hypothetical protein